LTQIKTRRQSVPARGVACVLSPAGAAAAAAALARLGPAAVASDAGGKMQSWNLRAAAVSQQAHRLPELPSS
jgi:hypothetical protein